MTHPGPAGPPPPPPYNPQRLPPRITQGQPDYLAHGQPPPAGWRSPAPVMRAPRKPALSRRQLWFSLSAGGASFLLISIGVTQFLFIVLGLTGVLALGGALQLGTGNIDKFGGLADMVMTHILISAVVCVGLCLLGIGVSALLLRIGRVDRIVAVTASGIGAAAVVWQNIAWIFVMLWLEALPSAYTFETDPDPHAQAALVMIVIGAILASVVIGALSWWLMAHIFRRSPRAQRG